MVPESLNCLLCNGRAEYFATARGNRYYRCTLCRSVMMDPKQFLSPEKEKQRYDQHNNDVYDPGYRKFVQPLVDRITRNYSTETKGLDFGAGSGPVSSVMLKEMGYDAIELYDPYYHPDRSVLSKQYHFIICCEVIEHFQNPAESFKLLRSLLLPDGALFCMTELYSEGLDFMSWYYKNDSTHVFFYHRRAMRWIRKTYGFTDLWIQNRLAHFKTKGIRS